MFYLFSVAAGLIDFNAGTVTIHAGLVHAALLHILYGNYVMSTSQPYLPQGYLMPQGQLLLPQRRFRSVFVTYHIQVLVFLVFLVLYFHFHHIIIMPCISLILV